MTYELNVDLSSSIDLADLSTPIAGGDSGNIGTMSVVGNIAAGGSALIQLFAVLSEVQNQKSRERTELMILEHKRKMADLMAKDAEKRGHEAEALLRQKGKKTVGSQKVQFAGQGIRVTGDVSAQDIMQETKDVTELDAMTIKNNAARKL